MPNFLLFSFGCDGSVIRRVLAYSHRRLYVLGGVVQNGAHLLKVVGGIGFMPAAQIKDFASAAAPYAAAAHYFFR